MNKDMTTLLKGGHFNLALALALTVTVVVTSYKKSSPQAA